MANPLNTTGLGSLSTLTGTFQGSLNNALNLGSSKIDQWFPPEKREYWKARLSKFAAEKPYLATFLLSQLALSGPVLGLFAIMTVTVIVFALLAGILVGLLGALLFIVFAVGVALLFLLPTLFFSTFAGVFIWLWGVGAYFLVKWFNQKQVPGVHTPLKGGITKQTGLDSVPLLGSDGGNKEEDGESEKPHRVKKERRSAGEINGHHSHTTGKDGDDEKENKPPAMPKKLGSVGKGTGADVTGQVGDVKKKVGGITSAVGVQA